MATLIHRIMAKGQGKKKDFHSNLSYFLWYAIVSSLEIVVDIKKDILIILFQIHVKIKRYFHWIC